MNRTDSLEVEKFFLIELQNWENLLKESSRIDMENTLKRQQMLDLQIPFEKLAAQRIWQSIPKERREDMMFQTQSKSYQEWMKEDEWDVAIEPLPSNASLPLAEFKA
jgi:hypothetical protein